MKTFWEVAAAIGLAAGLGGAALAETPGVTDTEIKLGQTGAYSGPASIASPVVKSTVAYFNMVNDNGGINGRKINLISLDDGYSPPKTVELTRKLVEQDEVLLLFGQVGSANGIAVRDYLNSMEVPQLLMQSGASALNNPKDYPWTIATSITYRGEAVEFGKYLAKQMPDAKVAIIYQNDDFGRDYHEGVRDGLGDKTDMIVAEQSFETSDPTINSQLLSLKSSGADVLVIGAVTKFAIMSLRFLGENDWHPQVMLSNGSTSISNVLEPAGFENAKGAITATPYKDPATAKANNDPEYEKYAAFMAKYAPDLNPNDTYAQSGYIGVQIMEEILKRAGDDLSRENIKAVATNFEGFRPGMIGEAVSIRITPDNYQMYDRLQFMRFDGEKWVSFDAGL